MKLPQRLDEARLRSLVDRVAVAAPLFADALRRWPVDAEPIAVPDVMPVDTYRLVVHAPQRPVELSVAMLPSGDVLVLGNSAAVDELALRVGLRLTSREEVADYIRFWCHVALRRTERLVEGPADFRWIPGVTIDAELRARADRAAHLARRVVVGHPAGNAYPAEVTVLDQRTLELRRLRVEATGHVDIVERVVLEQDVPVPYTIP
jgi:hypothetical protein